MRVEFPEMTGTNGRQTDHADGDRAALHLGPRPRLGTEVQVPSGQHLPWCTAGSCESAGRHEALTPDLLGLVLFQTLCFVMKSGPLWLPVPCGSARPGLGPGTLLTSGRTATARAPPHRRAPLAAVWAGGRPRDVLRTPSARKRAASRGPFSLHY